MAIEKLSLAYVVGNKNQVESFAQRVYLFEDIEVLNAMAEIEAGSFLLPLTEENLDGIIGLKDLETTTDKENRKRIEKTLKSLDERYKGALKPDFSKIKNQMLDTNKIIEDVNNFDSSILTDKGSELERIQEELNNIRNSIEYYSYLKNLDIPMEEINTMENFSCHLGSIPSSNIQRLKLIIPSLPSFIFHVGDTENEAVYYVVSGNDFKVETDRVLKALDFKELKGFNEKFTETPSEIVKDLTIKERDLAIKEAQAQSDVNDILAKAKQKADLFYTQLTMLGYVDSIESHMAFSPEKFYFSGWIPTRCKDEFKSEMDGLDLTIQFLEPKDRKIPTKLRNNWLFRPFEQLVEMYGVPNYKELDPTPFFALTYILFFGYMFGDVGQGAVLLLAGWIAERKGIALGGVATRVSIASIIFGFLYGSVFGIETILPAIWLRPMEDTNTLLITAIVVGVVILIISYIFSLINKKRESETQEEYFGKNGISGFLVYLLVLIVFCMFMNYIPDNLIIRDTLIVCIIVFTILVFLGTPLMNLVRHRKFSHDVTGDYYASSFFEVFEMYLSMFSNTLSFIRVGAFALTHVGMFMAFQTIAEMAGEGISGVIILIIGNVFILVLEGLIDFIQCLRLEFYELFGKYYTGDGIEFTPITIELKGQNL